MSLVLMDWWQRKSLDLSNTTEMRPILGLIELNFPLLGKRIGKMGCYSSRTGLKEAHDDWRFGAWKVFFLPSGSYAAAAIIAQEAAKQELKYIKTQDVRTRLYSHSDKKLHYWLGQCNHDENGSFQKSSPLVPANEPQWAWPISVHQNPQGQSGCTQEERANGEAQIQNLLLLNTTSPLTALHWCHVGVDSLILWIGSEEREVRRK